MDDRHNLCDVCRKPILEWEWNNRLSESMPTGQVEVETPRGLVNVSRFGDGVCHQACLDKLVKIDAGAGI